MSDLVPVLRRCGEHERAVGGERLLERCQLQHVGAADREGHDDPAAAKLAHRDRPAPFPPDERIGGQRGRHSIDDIAHEASLGRRRGAVIVAADDPFSFRRMICG